MSRTHINAILVNTIFTPDKLSGISEWKTRDEIDKTDLKLGTNGNIRQNTPWTDKYIWDVERSNNKPRGKPLRFRTIGFSKEKILSHPIKSVIRSELLKNYNGCIHCGIHKDLCIDHKNDIYNNTRVLCEDTQVKEDFQVLCNKCNKDLKHQINVKEIKTGKLHKVKELNILPFINDNFNYPWEKSLTNYDVDNLHCKMYTYWYDIEDFHRKRDIYIMITRPVNAYILKHIKLMS